MPRARRQFGSQSANILYALIIALLIPAASPAQQIHRVHAGHCIAAIDDGEGPGRGIATPALARRAFVTLCDGSRFRILLKDGAPRLVASPPVAPLSRDPAMLPDGEFTRGAGRITGAWLSGPTRRYGHGILGDAIEASGIHALLRNGDGADFTLDDNSVFEDLRARLVDLDGDGEDELVAIRTYLDAGAALAVYRFQNGRIAPLAESDAIGLSHRWLNPAGVADFDGDGAIEIAHVETPHIGGILRVHALVAGRPRLLLKYSAYDFSNHSIGSRVLDMSAVVDWNGDGVPDLAAPDAGRRRMRVVSFSDGRFSELAAIDNAAEIVTEVLGTDLNGDGAPELLYGLRGCAAARWCWRGRDQPERGREDDYRTRAAVVSRNHQNRRAGAGDPDRGVRGRHPVRRTRAGRPHRDCRRQSRRRLCRVRRAL